VVVCPLQSLVYRAGGGIGSASRSNDTAGWPLHDIAIPNIVCCMAYKRGVGGGGAYIAQKSYTSIAIVWALQAGGQ